MEKEFVDLEFIIEEKEKIGNPDKVGEVILDEIWKQFGNQIGLDITNETLIQKYERENPETYNEVGKEVMQDKRYKDANREMKEKQEAGNLIDEYTGKKIETTEKANLDHVVSRKEINENKRRKQANLSTKELANKSENLKATNESLNKSKGAKDIDTYLNTREEREQDLKMQNERANKKIEESKKSESEKKQLKEKNNKRLQDKLDADSELMRNRDKEARKAINKDIKKGAVKQVSKKVGIDAIKEMVVSGLFLMLKEIMNSLIRFLKAKKKTMTTFLEEMKKSIQSFFNKIKGVFKTGATSMVGTVLSEIFGVIVSKFKKLASMIKQGVGSIKDAVKYLTDSRNKNKPFSTKVAQVGKIIIAGIIGVGAITLGEIFEKLLLVIPGMQIILPMVGSLANVLGIFLASLISGIFGAIIINQIDRIISKKQKEEIVGNQIEKSNSILNLQHQVRIVNEVKLEDLKMNSSNQIKERHIDAASTMTDSLNEIFKNCEISDSLENKFDDIDNLFKELEGDII